MSSLPSAQARSLLHYSDKTATGVSMSWFWRIFGRDQKRKQQQRNAPPPDEELRPGNVWQVDVETGEWRQVAATDKIKREGDNYTIEVD